MKKFLNIIVGGIQSKIFNLVMVTALMIVASYAGVTWYQTRSLSRLVKETNEKQQASIDEISSESMMNLMEDSLGRNIELESYIADDALGGLQSNVLMVGEYAEVLLAHPARYPSRIPAGPSAENDGKPAVQLLLSEGVSLDDPDVAAKAGLLGNISEMMCSVYNNSPEMNSCYIAAPEGIIIAVDEHSAQKVDENGNVRSFPVTERPWYIAAEKAGHVVFTGVERDYFSGRVGIICAVPIYINGELEAVVGADLFLDSMTEAFSVPENEGTILCIINERGQVIFSSEEEGLFRATPADQARDLRSRWYGELAEFIQNVLDGSRDVGLVKASGKEYYMAGARLESVGLAIISVVDKELTEQPAVMMNERLNEIQNEASLAYNESIYRSRTTILLLLSGIFILTIVNARWLGRWIVRPLEKMTKRVGSLSGDNLQFTMEDTFRTGDEIEVLAQSFANLSEKTMHYIDEVQRATAEKERIGSELRMAKDIQASQLPNKFPPYPERSEFSLYASMDPAKEVGGDFYDFFLIDDDHLALVMADVSGKGIPASLFMMVSRILIKTHLTDGEDPATTLMRVNNQLLEGNGAEMFVTVWLAVVNLVDGTGVAVNAGHEHPVIRRAGGPYELLEYKHSPAVATMEDMIYKSHTFELHPGDSLFVYTDGVPEAVNAAKEQFGTARLVEALNTDPDRDVQSTVEAVTEAISVFVQDEEQFDDITMLCFEYNGPSKPEGQA